MFPVLLGAFLFFHAGPAPAASPLDGAWAGQIGGSAGPSYVGITVIAGGSAIVHYSSPYNCDGTWHELSQQGNVYTYRETILYQYSLFPGPQCPDQDTIVMTLAPATNSVQYASSTRGASGVLSGQLDNVTAPDPPGWNAPM
jgi:hypothetical protein